MSISLAVKSLFKSNRSNEWLVVRYAQSRDKQVLAQLYDNCSDDLYHFVLTQSDPHLAKDICQKTWLKVIEKPHLYQQTGRFSAWLFTVARNLLMDEYRRTDRLKSLDQMAPPATEMLRGDKTDLQARFNFYLNAMPFHQKEAFCLQQEGFGLQEIADITHCPTETVKSRLRYARQFLRSKLETQHD